MILHVRNKLTLITKLIQVPNQNPIQPFPQVPSDIEREREREGGLALDAATMPPPSAENATFRTLPPSDSHCHGVLLLHAACTALSVLPPPISG